ncbi:myb-related transcription factor, partner of profilin-like [Ornithodoros turicata]|uniref:myb-related transcription factor, partner of profilin-like n=1 Tax=Ornithodoros turicata TaxID=34597 RepID=UPI003139577A
MLNYISEHRNLFTGGLSAGYTSQDRNKEWCELAARLNASGGAVKPVERWRKTWTDWKSATKAKAARISQHTRGTGGGPPPKESLSELEERLTSMIGQVATTGMQETQEFGTRAPPALESASTVI